MPQRAEPAQHRRGEHAHERAIAVFQRRKAGMHVHTVELFVERPALAQYGFENFGSDAARGEPGRFGVHRLMRTHHAWSQSRC